MSWRLAHSLRQLQQELDQAYPNRTTPDWTIGDAAHRNRPSDHNPNAAGVVCAMDVRGANMGRILWEHIRTRRPNQVKYMIFQGRIMSATTSPWVSRSYSGSNPHNDHIHISVGRGPDGRSTRSDLYDSTTSWGISGAAGGIDSMTNFLGMERGDRGEHVSDYQKLLDDMGYPPANSRTRDGGWDGIYGSGVAASTLQVRVDNGSSVDPNGNGGNKINYWTNNQIRRGYFRAMLQRYGG